jgi:hypothetical protein
MSLFSSISRYSSGVTAIADQTSHKKNFESVASQRFQNFSWLRFEREAL